MLERRSVYTTTSPHLSGRSKWVSCAVAVVALATLGTACASDDSDVPATTVDGTPSTTIDPAANGPQPSLEPGSNLPPDEEPNVPANTDDTSATSTAGTTVDTAG